MHDQSKRPQIEDVNPLDIDNGRGELPAGESEKVNTVAGDETRRDCGEAGEDCSSGVGIAQRWVKPAEW